MLEQVGEAWEGRTVAYSLDELGEAARGRGGVLTPEDGADLVAPLLPQPRCPHEPSEGDLNHSS